MSPYPIPEIKRVALESVALTVKVVHDDVKVSREVFYTNFDSPFVSAGLSRARY